MGAFLLAGGLLTVPAQASDYPSKPIQLVSPYGAGGDSDLTARVWAEFAKKKLGQPVVVVNKTGGGGLTGSLFAPQKQAGGRRPARQPLRGQGQARRLHVVPRAGRAEHHHPADRQGRKLQLRQLRLHRPHHGRQLRRGREQGRPVEQPQGI